MFELQPGDLSPGLQILFTFLPIWGAVLMILIASVLRGSARRMALFFGPLLMLLVMRGIGSAVLYNGNLLAAVIYGFAVPVIALYYVFYLVAAMGLWLRHNAQKRRQQAAAGAASATPNRVG